VPNVGIANIYDVGSFFGFSWNDSMVMYVVKLVALAQRW
jgi:hypothetical protein